MAEQAVSPNDAAVFLKSKNSIRTRFCFYRVGDFYEMFYDER